MATDARLGMLVDAKNQTKTVFDQVRKDMNSLAPVAGAVNQQMGMLGSTMSSLLSGSPAAAFAALGASIGALKFGEAVVDMAKTAAQVGVLRDSLEDLSATAGTSGDAIVSALQHASGGAIKEQSLILSANRSMILGVADSAEEMTSLMEAAIVRGRAMGLSAEQAFSDLVTGIGRMSPLILDNLGIVTGGEKVFDDYAAALGRTAAQLTDVERKQALVNTVISSSASLVAQAGDISQSVSQFDRLTVATQTFKLALGEAFAPSVISMAQSLADAINNITEAMKETPTQRSQDATANRWGVQGIDTSEAGVAARGIAQEAASDIEAINNQMASLRDTIDIMRGTLRNMMPDDIGFDELNSKIAEAEGLLRSLQSQLVETSSKANIPSNAYWDFVQATNAAQQGANALKTAVETLTSAESVASQSTLIFAGNLGYLGQVAANQTGVMLALANATALASSKMAALAGGVMGEMQQAALSAVQSGASPEALAKILSDAERAADDAVANVQLTFKPDGSAETAESQFRSKLAVDQATASYRSQIEAIQKSLDTNKEFAESYEQLGRSAQQAGANIASGLVPTVGVDAALGKAEELTGQTQAQIDAWLQAGYGIEQIESVLLPSYLDGLREANTLAVAHGGAVDNIGASYDDLKGKVQGVVSEALNLDVGISPDDFLPREDAVNENARRLAAIMRDGLVGQPWLEEFKTEVPAIFAELAASDDPRQAAANMLKQFEAGMRPELLDKGKAKEIVRNMLLGEAATGALVDEIAGELAAELGISIEKAKAAAGASLGVPQPTAAEPVSLQIAPPAPVVVPMSYGTPEDAVLPTIEPVVVGLAWGELPEWTPPESLPSVVIPVSFATETYVLPTIESITVGLAWGAIPEWTQPEIPTATIPVRFSTGENLESGISAISASFTAGIESVNAGAKLAGQITAQLSGAASLAGFKNAGVSAAGTWGDAFLDRVSEGVPAQLISMLVSLITPEIQAQQQQVATRTGAAI